MSKTDITMGRVIVKKCQTCRFARPGNQNNDMIFCKQIWRDTFPDGCPNYEKKVGVCKLNAGDSDSMLPTGEEQEGAGY